MSERDGSGSTAILHQPDNTAVWLAHLLAKAGLRAALIGGQAVNAWSRQRSTNDYDFCVVADRVAIEDAEASLQKEGFACLTPLDADEPSGPNFVRIKKAEPIIIIDMQSANTFRQPNPG